MSSHKHLSTGKAITATAQLQLDPPWGAQGSPGSLLQHLKCSQRSMEILSDCKSRLDISRLPGNPQTLLSTDLP